jgi:predicted nucleotidyltransferase
MIALLKNKREEIARLCKQFGIRRLEVFGSAATGAFNPESSDLDFLVDLGGYERGVAKRYLRFAEALEQVLGFDVDLVTEDSITNPYFRHSVGQNREFVYGTRDREAVA